MKKGHRNYFKLLGTEIGLLGGISFSFLLFSHTYNSINQTCPNNIWEIIPYIEMLGSQICHSGISIYVLGIYYSSSLFVIVVFQTLYLLERKKLSISNYYKFIFLAILLLFVLWSWLSGRENRSMLFSFDMHHGNFFGIFTFSIVVPSLQFILSILLLEEGD